MSKSKAATLAAYKLMLAQAAKPAATAVTTGGTDAKGVWHAPSWSRKKKATAATAGVRALARSLTQRHAFIGPQTNLGPIINGTRVIFQ